MTEPTPTGALACPFVAFEDDRDARADAPDHRHRCYAEIRPAPRAIAHQEAFCLSPGFAACPTFQDWARREAARAKPAGDRSELAGLARPGRSQDASNASDDDDQYAGSGAGYAALGGGAVPPSSSRPGDAGAGRSKSRDWAAPPAWVAGADNDPDDAEAPAFLGGSGAGGGGGARGAGVSGSGGGRSASDQGANAAGGAAAGLAGSRWLNEARSEPAADAELADLDRSVGADRAARQGREATARRAVAAAGGAEYLDDDEDAAGVRPVASAVASPGRRANQVSRRPPAPVGSGRPAWERGRRNEAYPTLKTRVGMPAIPRFVLALGALVIAAVVIFALPFLFNFGGAPGATTPPASVGPSDNGQASTGPSASVSSVPSPHLYTVVATDTLTKIAKRFGVTIAQILAANPQIKNANNIHAGDKITIPSAAPSDEITGASPSPS
jgi:nucleoid-associated protein YgaU